jgi:hypothetical protein
VISLGKIIRKIISIAFAIYAGVTSFGGALLILEEERGITEPSTAVLFVIGTLSLFILLFSGIGASEFLAKYIDKK